MISINSLSLIIENKIFFKNISMSFLPSSIIYLTGKNGAGKTSLLRMLAGIQSPSKGSITFGTNSLPIEQFKKPYCTYIGHNIAIKLELTLLENLKIWAKYYNAYELLDAAISYFALDEIIDKKCYELSAGNQKKIALAKLIICPSKLWLLDEIDSNLDENNKKLLLNLILTHADNGGIVFIASHLLPEIKTAQILNLLEYQY